MKEKYICLKFNCVTREINISHKTFLSYFYQSTNRICKDKIFPFGCISNIALATSHMAFSSYSGYLESLDDFYILHSRLAMLQTRNGMPNTSLYDSIPTNSLYAWQRVRIANALASIGRKWYSYLSNQNSGTHKKQYMVIKCGAFEIEESLPDDFVWVIKQINIPGTVAGIHVTYIVERWCWASYNVPIIEEIFNKSGYPELVVNSATYIESCNCKHDAIENNNPFWVICSRVDLLLFGASLVGCYDTNTINLSNV